MTLPPDALFFDAAGTLIEVAEPVGTVYARYFAEAGYSCEPQIVNKAFRAAFATSPAPTFADAESGEEAEQAWWQELVARVFLHCHPGEETFLGTPRFQSLFDALFAHYADSTAWTVFPDVLPALERAQPHARLLVVSNFDRRLHGIFEGLGLAGYFEHIVTSSEAAARKPDTRIFQQALTLAGVAPNAAAHVGDSPVADLAGAQEAGITGFLVERPENSLLDFLDFCRIGTN